MEAQFSGLKLLNESPRRKKVTPRDLQVPTVTQPCAAEKLTPTTPSVQQLISFATPRATTAAGDADSVAEFIAAENVQPNKGHFSEQLYKFVEWQHLSIRLACGLFFRNAWLFPVNGIAPMPKTEQIQKMTKEVEAILGLLERLWLEKDFLIGDQMTVADLLPK
ncbi:GL26929 [Drosophila persimilis]|uniref:GL26929 n=1 Tax=Drosophila persimilis TaxID=7234 RepID=B4HC74_DROPE|nr:GL26929 [Drosophila persimilis]